MTVGAGQLLAATKEVIRRGYGDLFTRGRGELGGNLMTGDCGNHDLLPGAVDPRGRAGDGGGL